MIGSEKKEENSISRHVSGVYYKMVLLMMNINTFFQKISIFQLLIMEVGIIEVFFCPIPSSRELTSSKSWAKRNPSIKTLLALKSRRRSSSPQLRTPCCCTTACASGHLEQMALSQQTKFSEADDFKLDFYYHVIILILTHLFFFSCNKQLFLSSWLNMLMCSSLCTCVSVHTLCTFVCVHVSFLHSSSFLTSYMAVSKNIFKWAI